MAGFVFSFWKLLEDLSLYIGANVPISAILFWVDSNIMSLSQAVVPDFIVSALSELLSSSAVNKEYSRRSKRNPLREELREI